MKLFHSIRSKAAAAIAVGLVTLCVGVVVGTGLTGAASPHKGRAPKECITAIHDYQLVRTELLGMLTAADRYLPLISTAGKAGLTGTKAIVTKVLATVKTITGTMKTEAAGVAVVERKAVVAAGKCERG